VLPGSGALLVHHQTSLDVNSAEAQLSAFARDGTVAWTAPSPAWRIESATVVGDRVVVVGAQPNNRQDIVEAVYGGRGVIFAVSAADGRRLWQLDP
jgi:outer membrane protein assembly factor BamB